MTPSDRLVAGKRAEEDAAELALRPQTLDDFIGQRQVREAPRAEGRHRRIRNSVTFHHRGRMQAERIEIFPRAVLAALSRDGRDGSKGAQRQLGPRRIDQELTGAHASAPGHGTAMPGLA